MKTVGTMRVCDDKSIVVWCLGKSKQVRDHEGLNDASLRQFHADYLWPWLIPTAIDNINI